MSSVSIRRRCGAFIDTLAEQWIGFSFPPVERAIAEAQWKPDVPDAYCRRCGDSVASGEATETGCGTCRTGAELSGGIGDGVLRLGTYSDHLRLWVRTIKYHRWTEMGEHLGVCLARCVHESAMIDPQRTIVVPMAVPWQRRWYRGIDHSRVIADAVAADLRVPVMSILRRRHHPPQVSLSPTDRRRSGGKGLAVRRRLGGWAVQDRHLLLIDDVRTTGATLKAGCRLLRTLKPQRVVCAVIAVSDSKARRERNESLAASATM